MLKDMLKKQIEIEKMRGAIGQKILDTKATYKEMSPQERFIYTQRAFNDVNQLCAKMWNYNPDDIPFGFFIGRNSAAYAMNLGHGRSGVGFNISTVFKSKDPAEIYEVLFHEMKHVHQNMTKTIGSSLQKVFCPNRGKTETITSWKASPKEVEADNFAYSQMAKLYTRGGFLKFPYRVVSAEQHNFFRVAQIKSFGEHITGLAKYVLSPVTKLFTKSKEVKITNSPRGLQMFNLKEIVNVYDRNEGLKDAKPYDQGTVIREYLNSRGPELHTLRGYFKNSSFHQQEALSVLQNTPPQAENVVTNGPEVKVLATQIAASITEKHSTSETFKSVVENIHQTHGQQQVSAEENLEGASLVTNSQSEQDVAPAIEAPATPTDNSNAAESIAPDAGIEMEA